MIVDAAEKATTHRVEHSDGCASIVIATNSVVKAGLMVPNDGPSRVTTLVTMIAVDPIRRVVDGVCVPPPVVASLVAGFSVVDVCVGGGAWMEEAVTTCKDMINARSG